VPFGQTDGVGANLSPESWPGLAAAGMAGWAGAARDAQADVQTRLNVD